MHRIESITAIPKRIDLFGAADWTTCFSAKDGSGAAIIAASSDPLFHVDHSAGVYGLWAFSGKKSELNVLLGRPFLNSKRAAERYESRRTSLGMVALLAPIISRMVPYQPDIDSILNFASASRFLEDPFGRELSECVETLRREFSVSWVKWGQVSVALLVNNKDVGIPQAGKNLTVGDNRLDLVQGTATALYDYHYVRHSIWQAIPRFLSLSDDRDWQLIRNYFADPIAFRPGLVPPPNAFLWPWQRCLERASSQSPLVTHREIPTTSLVLDLRKSTAAMALSINSASFAGFIDEVVAVCRNLVVQNGGFFDKETGDGCVCHFEDQSIKYGRNESNASAKYAVAAARQLIENVSEVCRRYQSRLSHGLVGLGPAIGIHTGNAVWLADEQHVRGIGSSVVGASRLCSQAGKNEILISNRTLADLEVSGPSGVTKTMKQREISVKEYGEGPNIYAHSLFVI